MKRVFLPPSSLADGGCEIEGDYHRQVSYTLRSRPGEKFCAVCGDGFEYIIEIESVTSKKTKFKIVEKNRKDLEPSLKITLFAGMLKAGGLEEILPSLVYLGVNQIVPIITERSEVKLKKEKKGRSERQKKIIERALTLSHRTGMTTISQPMELSQAFSLIDDFDLSIIFHEGAEIVPLKETLAGTNFHMAKTVALFTGPEGGFTEEEASAIRSAGAVTASLGKRILDARTAPVAAVTALLYESRNV